VSQTLIHLALVFGGLSLLAVGGGSSLLPEMQTICVANGWIDAEGFSESYSLGQVVPGPPMTMVVLLGYHAAGVSGAVVVLLAFFTPACVLTLFVSRIWDRFSSSPWRKAIENGLAPVSIGLLVSGAIAIGQGVGMFVEPFYLAIGLGAMGLTLWRNANPAILVLGCGLLGFLKGFVM